VTGEVQYSRPRGFYVTAYTHVGKSNTTPLIPQPPCVTATIRNLG
jgi:hypothetical protein